MIKGWKKLSKVELGHLKRNGCNNTILFQRTIDQQAEQDRDSRGLVKPCWECYFIAKKLGVKPNGDWYRVEK